MNRFSSLAQALSITALVAASAGPAVASDSVQWISSAKKDGYCPDAGYDYAVRLAGIADDFNFAPNGVLSERNDGTATLTGFLSSKLYPNLSFKVRIDFVGGNTAAAPMTMLDASAYSANGGPVDPASWRFYSSFSGSLVGIGDMLGAKINLVSTGPEFQVGVGASNRNVENGAYGEFTANVVSQATNGQTLPGSTGGNLTFGVGDDAGFCSQDGVADSSAVWATDHAFILLSNLGDYSLIGPGLFQEQANGTATLGATIQSDVNPAKTFSVHLDLSGRVDPGDANYPPPGSPKKELAASAYIENGGVVDTNTWHYYTGLTGTIIGAGAYDGALLSVSLVGPALQVGFGANGKNVDFGVASWIHMTLISPPTNSNDTFKDEFDGDLNLNLATDCEDWPSAAPSNASALYQSDHAFTLYSTGNDFVFQNGAGFFTEFGDGTAVMTGVIERKSDPMQAFTVQINFDDRCDPGDANYPPVGSPKKELIASAYIENGGPIDTATWRYYKSFNGTMTGMGKYEGALISVSRLGPAFQVGFGASGKNFSYGASCWLDLITISQPTSGGITFPSQQTGDTNVDFGADCPVEETSYGAGCPGTGHEVPSMTLAGVPDAGNLIALELADGMPNAGWVMVIGSDRGVIQMPTGCMSNVNNVLSIIAMPPLSAEGGLVMPKLLPQVPSALTFTVEAWIFDPGAMGHLSVTNGVEITIK